MQDLCLIACSARKCSEPREAIAAIQRYDGIFFRVLKKWLRESSRHEVEILIISARFGLITAGTLIPNYDQRMTKLRAAELATSVSAALLARLQEKSYERVFVNLGKDYEPAIAGVELLKQARWASGSIGKRARQMKQWLEEAS
jgi:hypothetical protein